jgi:hypothetical protein
LDDKNGNRWPGLQKTVSFSNSDPKLSDRPAAPRLPFAP